MKLVFHLSEQQVGDMLYAIQSTIDELQYRTGNLAGDYEPEEMEAMYKRIVRLSDIETELSLGRATTTIMRRRSNP